MKTLNLAHDRIRLHAGAPRTPASATKRNWPIRMKKNSGRVIN